MERKCAACSPPAQRLPQIDTAYAIDMTNPLGQGTYGAVYKAMRKDDGQAVVVKESRNINKNDYAADFIREVSTLQALKGHPDVVRILDYVMEPKSRFIVLEAASTSLKKDIKTNPGKYGPHSPVTRQAMYEIMRGMNYLTHLGILHRDLKPDNVLVMADGKYKITDFGLSRGGPFQTMSKSGAVYTLWYRSPEILIQKLAFPKAHTLDYDVPADVWSVGITMWDMLAAQGDSEAQDMLRGYDESNQLYQYMWSLGSASFDFNVGQCGSQQKKDCDATIRQQMAQYQPDCYHRTPETARIKTMATLGFSDDVTSDLLFKLLDPNPAKRISFADALNHEYFATVDKSLDGVVPTHTQSQIDFADLGCPREVPPTSELKTHMWTILTDWLWEAMVNWDFSPATYFLALHILRCFFFRHPVTTKNLQDYGCAAFYLASQYMEVDPLTTNDVQYLHVITTPSLLNYVTEIFAAVGAQLHLPTSFVFLVQEMHETDPKKIFTRKGVSPSLILAALEVQSLVIDKHPRELALQAIELSKTNANLKETFAAMFKKAPGLYSTF